MFVITTVGMENASHEYTYKIKYIIENQKEKYRWKFIFLGANIDAISTEARFGINVDRTVNYNSDSEGTRLNYEAVNQAVSELRTSSQLLTDWKSENDKDIKNRGKKDKSYFKIFFL